MAEQRTGSFELLAVAEASMAEGASSCGRAES